MSESVNPSHWLPGQSGNPNGRPKKGETMTDVLKELCNETDESGVTTKQRIMSKMIRLADEGNMAALKYICDRIDGTPKQTVEQTGLDGKELYPNEITVTLKKASIDIDKIEH